jgi:hypothetical protein
MTNQSERQRRYYEKRKDTHRRTVVLLDIDAYHTLEQIAARRGETKREIINKAIRAFAKQTGVTQ